MPSKLGTFVRDDSIAGLAALLKDLKFALKVATDNFGLHRHDWRNYQPPIIQCDTIHFILRTK